MKKRKVTLEKDVEQGFLKKVKKAFPNLKCPKLSMLSQRSWPDRMIPLPGGRCLFIEFKRPGEVATPLQEDCHQYLRGLGHDVKVFDDADEAFLHLIRKMPR